MRLSPYAFNQQFTNDGLPLVGGKIYTYEAGTTTPKATYIDSSGSSSNTNPVVLDAAGRANIWLGGGAYKFILKDSSDVLISTVDNIAGDSENAFGSSVTTTAVNLNITSSYKNAVIYCTDALTLSLDSAITLGEGFVCSMANNGNGIVTIDPYGSETINGQSSLQLLQGQSCLIVSDGTKWASLFNSNGFTTGDIKMSFKAVADYGFVMMNDGTIGSASSGATTRANADTQALYELLWNNISNTWAPVSSGRGATAAADFAANKTLALTKVLGRALGIAGAGGSLTSRALGEWLGAEAHVLTIGEMPSHPHTINDPGHSHNYHVSGGLGGGLNRLNGTTNQLDAVSTTEVSVSNITINANGGGGAHNNMQPTFFCNVMIKL